MRKRGKTVFNGIINIGVITHTPYIDNYFYLINRLAEQIKDENNIKIVTLIQLEKEYRDRNFFENKIPNLKEYVLDEVLSPSNARNFIIEHTDGDWIAYIDGDCLIGEGYIEALKTAIDRAEADTTIYGIQGAIYARDASRYGKYEFFFDIISLLDLKTKEAKFFFEPIKENINENVEKCYQELELKYVKKFQGFNFVISRKLIDKIGGFNIDIQTAEDREYSARLNKIGGKILFQKELAVFHGYDMTLNRIIKRKRWHALGCGYLRKKYSEIYDLNIKFRILFSLDIFLSCRKWDYVFYQIICDLVFWWNVKKTMRRKD